MYANLRASGGSNHLFLPTGLIFQPGDVLWVESTTSKHINGIYPGEITHMLSASVRENLKAVGHSGREYGPYLARVLGAAAIAPPPEWRPPSRKTAEGFMVPAIELRRLLAEARAAGESFALTYRQRKPGGWRRVRVEQGPSRSKCRVLRRSWLVPLRPACTAEEQVLLATAPPAWAMRTLLFFPFAMTLNDDLNESSIELGCHS